MMELRPEYQKIVDGIRNRSKGFNDVDECALLCQKLADRPPKLLTDDEIDEVAENMPNAFDGFRKEWGYRQFARAVEAAHIAKQREPDTVPFDYEKWSKGGWQAISGTGAECHAIIPQHSYTMRRI